MHNIEVLTFLELILVKIESYCISYSHEIAMYFLFFDVVPGWHGDNDIQSASSYKIAHSWSFIL